VAVCPRPTHRGDISLRRTKPCFTCRRAVLLLSFVHTGCGALCLVAVPCAVARLVALFRHNVPRYAVKYHSRTKVILFSYMFYSAMLRYIARYMLTSCVCVSVTRRYCIKGKRLNVESRGASRIFVPKNSTKFEQGPRSTIRGQQMQVK